MTERALPRETGSHSSVGGTRCAVGAGHNSVKKVPAAAHRALPPASLQGGPIHVVRPRRRLHLEQPLHDGVEVGLREEQATKEQAKSGLP